jgi:DUF1365 family protein
VNSRLAFGTVRHRRFGPSRNAFAYRVALQYIDLDEAPALFKTPVLLSRDRPAVYSFRRRDYLGDPARPLADCVRDAVAARTGRRPAGPVRMLTQISVLGFCFNPVTFYYCFGAGGELEAVAAEITNTPWNERHLHALPWPAGKRSAAFSFQKEFHVSPFMPMDQDYRWRFTAPGRRLAVHMENFPSKKSGRVFDATLSLSLEPWTRWNLVRALVLHPAMAAKSFLSIYWQALVLWLKRASFHPHPVRGGTP